MTQRVCVCLCVVHIRLKCATCVGLSLSEHERPPNPMNYRMIIDYHGHSWAIIPFLKIAMWENTPFPGKSKS